MKYSDGSVVLNSSESINIKFKSMVLARGNTWCRCLLSNAMFETQSTLLSYIPIYLKKCIAVSNTPKKLYFSYRGFCLIAFLKRTRCIVQAILESENLHHTSTFHISYIHSMGSAFYKLDNNLRC